MSETKHTPTPYQIEDSYNDERILDAQGVIVADCATLKRHRAVRKANAEFIVQACNAHAALVEALRELEQSTQELLIRWRTSDEAYHDASGSKAEPPAGDTQTHRQAEARIAKARAGLRAAGEEV